MSSIFSIFINSKTLCLSLPSTSKGRQWVPAAQWHFFGWHGDGMAVKTDKRSWNTKFCWFAMNASRERERERERKVKPALTKALFLCFLKYATNLKQHLTNTLARLGSDVSACELSHWSDATMQRWRASLSISTNFKIESLAKSESKRKVFQSLAFARFYENVDDAEESAPFKVK